MRKVLVIAVMAVALLVLFSGAWRTTKNVETVAVEAKIETPAKSVREFAQRYVPVELTPVQRRLVEAGFDPTKTHSVTTK